MKTSKSEIKDFLVAKGATPTESDLFRIVLKLFKKVDRPICNGDIADEHGTHRTNIRSHMANMVRKGIILRHRHKFYLPAKVF